MDEDRRFEESGVVGINGVKEEDEEHYGDLCYGFGEEGLVDAVNERKDEHPSKLFVGGISWETTRETFLLYFSQYGQIVDSIVMLDWRSGRSRGFGFVTFADPAVADEVLKADHVIDGKMVDVKRTVPREDMGNNGVIPSSNKIFVGGIPSSLTEDELREHFSLYGIVVEHQIMVDRQTGRSRGFGFVTFKNEDAVKQTFSAGRIHELGGKQVEIKKAEPRRPGGDYCSAGKSRSRINIYSGGYNDCQSSGYGYNEKMGRGHGWYGCYFGYPPCEVYGGGFPGVATAFYGGCGYGFCFGGPVMYAGSRYGGTGFRPPGLNGAAGGYLGGTGDGRGSDRGNVGSGNENRSRLTVNGVHGNDREDEVTLYMGNERHHPHSTEEVKN
ncbi:hypothetical protein K2173_009377 [Erythroxylum novogranatense]|uniref:RRM domain-containing protein n=1 Tax=Erythroxylum novogranatense TaxID=1862640 RepID=A0AAV8U3T2_9ROSI|nr:hypothetical protein K2173_009377 [Erythroxylum novogranatense]